MISADESKTKALLSAVAAGAISIDDAYESLLQIDPLNGEQYEDLGFAKVDLSRRKRNGFAEVIFCEGKTPEQVGKIAASLLSKSPNLLATRADAAHYAALLAVADDAVYHERGRVIQVCREINPPTGRVAVVSAGTADQPVAEEAAVVAETLGTAVSRFSDVGVAGLHRLLSCLPEIRQADVIIVVAGMEGALVSVLGGLVDRPVLAVPSGIGYGANFHGVTTLLAMLNSCASGVAVLNIGNGFGAGYMAATICRQIDRARKETSC